MQADVLPRPWLTSIIELYKEVRLEKAKMDLKITKPRYQLTNEENYKLLRKACISKWRLRYIWDCKGKS